VSGRREKVEGGKLTWRWSGSKIENFWTNGLEIHQPIVRDAVAPPLGDGWVFHFAETGNF
jgi:hypothetical protein